MMAVRRFVAYTVTNTITSASTTPPTLAPTIMPISAGVLSPDADDVDVVVDVVVVVVTSLLLLSCDVVCVEMLQSTPVHPALHAHPTSVQTPCEHAGKHASLLASRHVSVVAAAGPNKIDNDVAVDGGAGQEKRSGPPFPKHLQNLSSSTGLSAAVTDTEMLGDTIAEAKKIAVSSEDTGTPRANTVCTTTFVSLAKNSRCKMCWVIRFGIVISSLFLPEM